MASARLLSLSGTSTDFDGGHGFHFGTMAMDGFGNDFMVWQGHMGRESWQWTVYLYWVTDV